MAIDDDAKFSQFLQEMEASMSAPDDNQAPPQEEEHPTATQEQEVPASDDTEVVAESEAEVEPEEKWVPQTLDDIAEAFELDEDAIKAIKVKTKVDGKEGEATLKDVIKNFQLDKALTERAETLAHMRKEYEQRFQQWEHQYAEKMQFADAFTGIMENSLKQQVANVDWKQLREDDPAEYAARRQEFMERIGELEALKAKVQNQRQIDAQRLYEQQNLAVRAAIEENVKRLPELIPEFKDRETMRAEMEELKQYLRSNAYKDEEIDSVYDARAIAVARKAMLYDKLVAKGLKKQAESKPKPKFVKPSARPIKEAVNQDKRLQKIRQLKRTGSVHDLAALILDNSN